MRLSDSGLFVQEIDGSPKGFCTTFKIINGALADNGDGSFTITIDHGALTGLSDDDHTIYLKLAARGSKQTVADEVEFSNNVYIGLMNFGTNPGAMAAFDMTVTAVVGAGTEESYDLNIDGTEFIKCYAESDGVGGLQNKSVDLSQLIQLKQSGTMCLFQRDEAVADDGYIDLPSNMAGFVFVSFNESAEYGVAVFTDTAAVILLHNSTNCVNTDTDTKYCIFDNGANVRVKNRSGGSINIKILAFMG